MAHAYEMITQQILTQLEQGTVPWRQPWRSPGAPKNLLSGRSYRGLNVWLLVAQPYVSPWWLTYKQAASIGGWVRKGEKGTTVVFWQFADAQTEEEFQEAPRVQRRAPLLRRYVVFNSEQCALPASLTQQLALQPTAIPEPLTQCERVIREMPHPPRIVHEARTAFYAPQPDLVNLPPRVLFPEPAEFFATAYHELTHSTGHRTRLARPGVMDLAPFASHAYSLEELTAELGAAYLCGTCGIAPLTLENSAAYIASWLERLHQDKSCF